MFLEREQSTATVCQWDIQMEASRRQSSEEKPALAISVALSASLIRSWVNSEKNSETAAADVSAPSDPVHFQTVFSKPKL